MNGIYARWSEIEMNKTLTAIHRQRAILEQAEHDLLLMVALQRAEKGHTERFPFCWRGLKETWYTSHIEDRQLGCKVLVIYYAARGNLYLEMPLTQAQDARDRLGS